MKWLRLTNREGRVSLREIPVANYLDFHESLCEMLQREECRLAEYFAMPVGGQLRFFALVAADASGEVLVACHDYKFFDSNSLESVTAFHPQAHPFEREIAELYGVAFEGNPWSKPLRFPAGRADRSSTQDNFPFYTIEGPQLHEVNVGPIHAGIIEPGAFRFVCHGEQVLNLDIALGYQHRGIEPLMCSATSALQRMCLAESIAGDSAVGHGTAHAMVMERLAGFVAPDALAAQRALGIELERIAVHLADVGALCTDIGYQLGQVACEALRTIVINTTQRVCGNRFGKGWVRPAGSRCALTDELRTEVENNIREVVRRLKEVVADLKNSPSVLARFEECGTLTRAEALQLGAVGVVARASNLDRDARRTHPWGPYCEEVKHDSIVREFGDVMARLTVRTREAAQSALYVEQLLPLCGEVPAPDYGLKSSGETLAFALVEGWRGEVCHAAVTDAQGNLACYKIKDPSVHNWMALTLAVRTRGISDFPVCNKSFNLSYCGHDL